MSPSEAHHPNRPLIVGVGGTTRCGSTSERALEYALAKARELGADTELLAGADILLPIYVPESIERNATARHFVAVLRRANGIIVASPGYHGSLSGLIKNALDYAEDMRDDGQPYFEGRAVGLIACANGWQATGATLTALRSIVHALRGWPTPLGVAINTSDGRFGEDNMPTNPATERQLSIVAAQVVQFAEQRAAYQRAGRASPLIA
ncbi:MAG TPA: NAD(P)H-dependent oxidoreductase [Steroidobacteraceae bacterium]|nr:NAD(P)H-dependent oxidoreductase [Steroidobacteraceae bacterium]